MMMMKMMLIVIGIVVVVVVAVITRVFAMHNFPFTRSITLSPLGPSSRIP
jgi:hypothetical protein